MKALSVRQPWAWAILNAGKRVENREWQIDGGNVRAALRLVESGETVLLHTGARVSAIEIHEAIDSIFCINRASPIPLDAATISGGFTLRHPSARSPYYGSPLWGPAPSLPFGGIVGRFRLAGVVWTDVGGHRWPLCDADRCLLCGEHDGAESPFCPKADPWAIPGTVGLVLADVEALPFVPYKGALGFFEVPR